MNLLIWLVVIAAVGAVAYYFLVMKKKGASPLAKQTGSSVQPSFTPEEKSEE